MKLLTHSVVFQLLLGALLKAVFSSVPFEDFLSWTTFAIIGLFITVGLEIHPHKFSNSLGLCVVLVLATTLIPFAGFWIISHAFGLNYLTSMTVAVILITTGTGVTVQTLSNLGYLHTKVGEFLTLVSALDDVPAAILMAYLMTMSPAGASLSLAGLSIYGSITIIFFLASFFLKSKKLLPVVFLLFGIGFSKVLENFHVSLVMGGLISGGVLSLLFRNKVPGIETSLSKILKPFLILYMIYIGMKLSPGFLNDEWAIYFTIVLTFFAIFIKWILTFLILKNQKDFSASIMAWGMVPRGVPGFAFATAAHTSGLISQEIFTILVLIVSVTTWIGLLGMELAIKKERQST